MFMIHVNKVIVFDRVSGNNWKDQWHILGYQVDSGSDRPTVYKDKQNIRGYGANQYDKK